MGAAGSRLDLGFSQREYMRIVSNIRKCNENPNILMDHDYDTLVKIANLIEKKHPKWMVDCEPRIKRRLFSWKDNLRLRKTYSLKRVQKFADSYSGGLTAEFKVNGIACSIFYKAGQCTRALTRSIPGKNMAFDITNLIKRFPKILKKLKMPFTGTIRGELFISKKGLASINRRRIRENLSPYIDPLSALVPLSRSSYCRNKSIMSEIQFFPYHLSRYKRILYPSFFKNRIELHYFFNQLGLDSDIPPPLLFYKTKDLLRYLINPAFCRRYCPTDIDGIVVRDLCLYSALKKNRTHYTAGLLGYKFPSEELQTSLKRVIFSISRRRIVTAVAEVEPIKATNGRTFSRIFIPNPCIIAGVKRGDSVSLKCVGGLIPVWKSFETKKSHKKNCAIRIPSRCPACSVRLLKKKNKFLFCPNTSCLGSSS